MIDSPKNKTKSVKIIQKYRKLTFMITIDDRTGALFSYLVDLRMFTMQHDDATMTYLVLQDSQTCVKKITFFTIQLSFSSYCLWSDRLS